MENKKEEIRHFTIEQKPENEYGDIDGQIVNEYLKNGYMKGQTQCEVTVCGKNWKGATWRQRVDNVFC